VTRFTQLKLAIALVGLIVWGYGQRVEDALLRWIGIAFLAVAVILRFLPRRLRREDYPES